MPTSATPATPPGSAGRRRRAGSSASRVRARTRRCSEKGVQLRSKRVILRALAKWIGSLSALASVVSWSAPRVDAAPPDTVYYVSVGDSLAGGYQPIGGPPNPNLGRGY